MNRTTIRRTAPALIVALCVFFAAFSQNSQAQRLDSDTRTALDVQAGIQKTIAKVLPTFVSFGGGSGVIISEDGYLITNYHVAVMIFRQTETTTVVSPTGKSYVARKIGWDQYGDTALCKIELPAGEKEKFPFAEFGDSDAVEVGQVVIAIGNPFSLGTGDAQPTVTVGVISGKNRFVVPQNTSGLVYGDAIMIDAAINPGNSGGPLFDVNGKLLGLNGLMFSRYGHRSNTSVGYSVSINQIKRFLPLLKENARVHHGTVAGLTFEPSPPETEGVKIKSVAAGSLAEKSGFKNGDVITEINGTPARTIADFFRLVTTWPEKTEFKVKVKRDGKVEQVSFVSEPILTSEDSPRQQAPPAENPDRPVLGVALDTTFEGPGARISSVAEGSGAAKAGLKAGDIILKIDGADVANLESAVQLLSGKKADDTVALTIKRGSETLNLSAKLMKASELPSPPPAPPEEKKPSEPGPKD